MPRKRVRLLLSLFLTTSTGRGTRKGLLASVLFLTSMPVQGHCIWSHPGHCLKDVVEAPVRIPTEVAKEIGKQLEKVDGGVGEVGGAIAKAAGDVQKTHSKAIDDVSRTIEKAGQDVDATLRKAGEDIDATLRKAGKDVNDAAIAIGHFLEREAQGVGDTLSDAEKRVREGKFIDAIWHLGTDPARRSEENAAKLAQESSLVNALAQVAASAYGGPGGAAAYAAWYTYRATGDVEMALRVGMMVGVTSAAVGAAGELPTGTSGELAKKAAVTGAIGGIGVAASGGDEDAIFEGFLKSGGMVLVQDGYESYTKHDIDPRGAQGDSYCVMTMGAECSPPSEAYLRDESGALVRDENGVPKVDMQYLEARRPHVGIGSPKDATGLVHELVEEGGVVMDSVAKIVPVTNAGSVFHDQWAIQWNMSRATNLATIAPAMVMTYYGTDGAINDLIRSTALDRQEDSADEATKAGAGVPQTTQVESSVGLTHHAFRCFNGELARVIQVDELDNKAHSVCRVIYSSEKGVSTPWYAKFNADYCLPKAIELVNKQANWGWSCFRL